MPIYFVEHPSIDVTAKINAPSTEKARTVYLDYLERNGLAGRWQRRQLRENMIAKLLKRPEDVSADLDLDYGYEEVGAAEFSLPESYVSVVPPIENESVVPTGASASPPLAAPVEEAPPPMTETPRLGGSVSRIARVSLGMGV